jgi:hypothetical protein
MRWFRALRIVLLLLIFVSIAFYSKKQKLKSRSWAEPLEVVIYPINGDNSAVIDEYISDLEKATFTEIEQFFQRESEYYSLSIPYPISIALGETLAKHPPQSPNPGSNFIAIVWWVLKFRYWAYRHTPDDESNLHRIRVFTHYHESLPGKKLQHSLGLDKGLLVVVHAFASIDQDQQNNIVIAHELLHTVGASDKYNSDGGPEFPHGYAEPNQQPLYPQNMAEIMAVRMALSEHSAQMAENLEQCIIGDKTAREINWVK